MKSYQIRSIIFGMCCMLAGGMLLGYAICMASNPDWLCGFCWQEKVSMKYISMGAVECNCDNPITDGCITWCTGDVDPADPMEDEDQYGY